MVEGTEFRNIAVERLSASPMNRRRVFRGIEELGQSLLVDGLLEPLLARPSGDGFEVVAGERRLRAARLVGLLELPCLVREMDDDTAFRIMVVENLQRDSLDPMEEASGIAAMQERACGTIRLRSRSGVRRRGCRGVRSCWTWSRAGISLWSERGVRPRRGGWTIGS